MAHYAKVKDGKVTRVIVAEQDFIDSYVDNEPGYWIQTSYNTKGGVHYKPNSIEPSEDQSKALRGNFAGPGYIYDDINDKFYVEQPFKSWVLNKTTWLWEAPVAKPNDNKIYNWDEATTAWVEVPVGE